MVDKDSSGLSIEEVEHLSMLARVGASKEDLEKMHNQMCGLKRVVMSNYNFQKQIIHLVHWMVILG